VLQVFQKSPKNGLYALDLYDCEESFPTDIVVVVENILPLLAGPSSGASLSLPSLLVGSSSLNESKAATIASMNLL